MSLLADLRPWGAVLLISMLGAGAALIPYYVGRRGTEAVLTRFPRLKEEYLGRVQALYQEHGSGLLFFSFIPILGMVLVAGAGVVGMQVSTFMLWVLAGRIVRNSILLVLIALGLLVLGVH